MSLTQDEVENRALEVLFDHVQAASERLSAEEVARLIGDNTTQIRAKMALSNLDSRSLIYTSYGMPGTSYEIKDAGYRLVEQRRGITSLANPDDTFAPASDRIVTSLDNYPLINVIRSEISKFSDELSQANDTGDLVGDRLVVAKAEIADLGQSYNRNSARISTLYNQAKGTLSWIGTEAAAALIGAAALALLGLIARLLGLI